jgi:RNA polymerase sigma factor (sigma-70 family)
MSGSPTIAFGHAGAPPESPDRLPAVVAELLAADGPAGEPAWAAFVGCYSGLLLRIATAFAPGYDGALDRYAFMLDELKRSEFRRLRGFAADGRGTFSTWLAVVARRLCLDHYRRQFGRFRGDIPASRPKGSLDRACRRNLARLEGVPEDLADLPTPMRADPVDELDHRERCAALRRALGSLPPRDQLLLRLRFEHELTARAIAAMLGLPSPFHVYRRLDAIYGVMRGLIEQNRDEGAVFPVGGPHATRRPAKAVGAKVPARRGERKETACILAG